MKREKKTDGQEELDTFKKKEYEWEREAKQEKMVNQRAQNQIKRGHKEETERKRRAVEMRTR